MQVRLISYSAETSIPVKLWEKEVPLMFVLSKISGSKTKTRSLSTVARNLFFGVYNSKFNNIIDWKTYSKNSLYIVFSSICLRGENASVHRSGYATALASHILFYVKDSIMLKWYSMSCTNKDFKSNFWRIKKLFYRIGFLVYFILNNTNIEEKILIYAIDFKFQFLTSNFFEADYIFVGRSWERDVLVVLVRGLGLIPDGLDAAGPQDGGPEVDGGDEGLMDKWRFTSIHRH